VSVCVCTRALPPRRQPPVACARALARARARVKELGELQPRQARGALSHRRTPNPPVCAFVPVHKAHLLRIHDPLKCVTAAIPSPPPFPPSLPPARVTAGKATLTPSRASAPSTAQQSASRAAAGTPSSSDITTEQPAARPRAATRRACMAPPPATMASSAPQLRTNSPMHEPTASEAVASRSSGRSSRGKVWSREHKKNPGAGGRFLGRVFARPRGGSEVGGGSVSAEVAAPVRGGVASGGVVGKNFDVNVKRIFTSPQRNAAVSTQRGAAGSPRRTPRPCP
jgi:hypothetical protein